MKGTYFRLLPYLKPHWYWILIGTATMLLASLLNLLIPWLTGFVLIDVVIGQNRLDLLQWVVLGLISIIALRGVASYFQGYLLGVVSQKTMYRLRTDLYERVQRLSLRFFDKSQTGEIQSRVVNDVNTLEDVIDSISDLGFYMIMLVSTFAFLLYLNPPLTLLVTMTLPIIFFSAYYLRRAVRESAAVVQRKLAAISARAQEVFSGIRVVKGFTMEEYEGRRFASEAREYLEANVRSTKLYAIYSPILELATILGTAVVILYSAPQIISGTFTIGKLVAYLGYLGFLYNPIRGLSMLNYVVQKGLAAADRIFEIMELPGEVQEDPDAVEMATVEGHVEFRNVSFGYESNRLVLKNFSLTVRPGEIVALVGPSGIGKSTVISLIPRFYDVLEGAVLIDAYDVREVKLRSLRSRIGLVLQETFLFSGTVRENIAYGKQGTTMEEIIEAAKAANAHEFISALPKGYETEVGERGMKLSMGERQRIAIARALLKNPAILILDEATSSVDSESELLIQEALEWLMSGRTTFVIAHRLSTLKKADKIIILEDGGISDIGTHGELARKEGFYRKLYELQIVPEKTLD